MPTIMGKPYDIYWRGRPPHMLRPDHPVWYRFLDKWGHIFTGLYYDVLLGGPTLTPEELKDPFKIMWRATTSKRADAIGITESEVWIIEVAAEQEMRALGQLMTYMTLWEEDPKFNLINIPVLVCETIDPDIIASAVRFGVQVYVMPAPPE